MALAVVAAVFIYVFWEDKSIEIQKQALPSPVSIQKTQTTASVASRTPGAKTQAQLPQEYNLDVPFTSQAPHGNWDRIHEDLCEEASILMAGRFYEGRGFGSPEDANQAMLDMVDWQNENFGYFESTDAEQTLQMMEEALNFEGELIYNPTAEKIKRYIYDKKLVIVPAAGRELGNPYFTQPGPLYHMYVIKGYTEDHFITNDPGTKRGANYPYSAETVLEANHDWNEGNVDEGERVMIVVSPQ